MLQLRGLLSDEVRLGYQLLLERGLLLSNLGNAYSSLGDAARAKELYKRALAIQEVVYGADHVNVARTRGGCAHGVLYRMWRPGRDFSTAKNEEKYRVVCR